MRKDVKKKVTAFSFELSFFISNLSHDRSTACSKSDLELPPSVESILFCPQGHPATSYVFFLVFLSLIYLSVCTRARASVQAGMRSVSVCKRVSECTRAKPARNAYAPYCDVICGPSFSTIYFEIIS
jgi:hypothetical protein